jgi:hypothetical protein
MSTRVKNQEEILAKLGITQLNPMQLATQGQQAVVDLATLEQAQALFHRLPLGLEPASGHDFGHELVVDHDVGSHPGTY